MAIYKDRTILNGGINGQGGQLTEVGDLERLDADQPLSRAWSPQDIHAVDVWRSRYDVPPTTELRVLKGNKLQNGVTYTLPAALDGESVFWLLQEGSSASISGNLRIEGFNYTTFSPDEGVGGATYNATTGNWEVGKLNISSINQVSTSERIDESESEIRFWSPADVHAVSVWRTTYDPPPGNILLKHKGNRLEDGRNYSLPATAGNGETVFWLVQEDVEAVIFGRLRINNVVGTYIEPDQGVGGATYNAVTGNWEIGKFT